MGMDIGQVLRHQHDPSWAKQSGSTVVVVGAHSRSLAAANSDEAGTNGLKTKLNQASEKA
ncbi:hypothetical protein PanWU01x14_236500 [Parasponia andersonii]|uniref:Uncharacterized protein n=1 Tax=Parasponia andersonii TaxID=3476 RepID=A0A2P5BIG3_PARAD|nr:hypothetical protein PanWU01x14_236500 [Parasponia andersonii]